jgi:hypothetical protein
MTTALSMRAMHAELTKLGTEGHGSSPHNYEEMDTAKWKQVLKDLPLAILGTAGGYAIGRTGAEYLAPHIFNTPASQEGLKKMLPAAVAATGGLGTYLLSMQRNKMKERRDAASREASGTKNEQETPSKLSGAPTPMIQARRQDPWREDTRYKIFR